MIDGHVRRIGGDAESAEILIVATATDGFEISEVHLVDRFGEEIFHETVPDCVASFEHRVLISQRRLPVSLTIRKCIVGTEQTFGPFVPPDPGTRPCDPAVPLPRSAACSIALQGTQRLARQITARCEDLRVLEALIDHTRTGVLFFLIVAAACLAAAAIALFFGPFGTPVALAMAGAAAFFAAASIVAGLLLFDRLTQRRTAKRRLEEARTDFRESAAEVRRQCCPHEIDISLDPPC